MNAEELQYFRDLTKDRTESANVLEKPSLSGVQHSVVEKYSDQAHFIYELLQNADDVEATEAKFFLFKDKIVFVHNGKRHFNVTNGSEGCWQVGPRELRNRIEQGRIRLGKETSYGFVINYLPDGEYAQVISGDYSIEGHDDNGALIAYKYNSFESRTVPPTQWKIASHDASAYGSSLLLSILNQKVFSFPKSLYAEHDTINFFVANKPNALIVDFFAGSGTTLHAVNLLNAEDGGHRRCILVTNNEVSEAENKELTEKGFKPGDEEWDKLGIARYVTWPRTVCSIEGHDVNGNPLKGNYIGSDIPMADGFKANANFFKLGFLDKTRVSLGMQFAEMLPTLWMKAGAIGECPSLDGKSVPEMLILPPLTKNKLYVALLHAPLFVFRFV